MCCMFRIFARILFLSDKTKRGVFVGKGYALNKNGWISCFGKCWRLDLLVSSPPLLKVLHRRVFTQDLEEGLRPSIIPEKGRYGNIGLFRQNSYASDGVMIDMASRYAPMSPSLGLLRGARASVDGVMIDMTSRCLEVKSDRTGGGYTAI
ncbi:hypothetical protein OSB04_003024 [Centaurea solstitialis]|uniref:Uncharacterized protein n=1 Tax=Centaurea solstitialis TaxID=347529 RepID=A0AA38TU14_9ASTR|nr:hypothetical protein OSB04_003024 [Centaurea solstitialis]